MEKKNFFKRISLLNSLYFIKLLIITFFIFFFDVKFKVFSIFFDLRFFSIFLFLIMLYEIRVFKRYKKLFFIFFIFFSFLLFHYFFNTISNFLKINFYSVGKIFNAVLILLSMYYYKNFIISNFNKIINIFLVLFFIILITFNIINFFNSNFSINCLFGCFSQNRFLFLENSHLAYVSPLIIFYYIFYSLKKENIKFFLFFLFFLISLIKNQSTTLLSSNILLSLFFLVFCFKDLNKSKVITFLCIFVISTIFIFKPTHMEKVNDFNNIFLELPNIYNFTSEDPDTDSSFNTDSSFRSNFSSNSGLKVKNLSSDVYFYNFKIAFASLIDNPFGWGLFNYEFAHQKYSVATTSYIVGSSWLNNNDGSNVLFKSFVEIGVLSFLIYIPFIFFLFSRKIDLQYKLLIAPPIITQVLIRGSGFFNGGLIIFFILYFYFLTKKN